MGEIKNLHADIAMWYAMQVCIHVCGAYRYTPKMPVAKAPHNSFRHTGYFVAARSQGDDFVAVKGVLIIIHTNE
jgi:hypothetical protein